MKLISLLLFSLLVYANSYAQYKQMLHKSYKDKVVDIDELYRNTLNKYKEDTLKISAYTQKMKQWALVNNDQELALEAELLKAYADWFIYGFKNPELVQPLITIADKGKRENVHHIEERAVRTIAGHYWNIKEYEKAFVWLIRSANILEKIDPQNYPTMASHLSFIGFCYYRFGDYANAATFFKKASELNKTTFNATSIIEAQNSLGLCYQNLGHIEQSNRWFLRIINDTSTFSNSIWKNIASGNLGYNYYLKGDYSAAIPLFETDVTGALTIDDYGLAAGSTIPLSDIYIQQNQLIKAKQNIDDALKYIQHSGQTDRLRKLYPIISKWYAANNEPRISMEYLDSAMVATKDYNEKYNSLQLLRATQTVEARDRELEVEKLKTESQIKITQRNYMIFLIALLLIGSLLVFWFRNKYLLRKQEIRGLELENTQKALSNAKNKLENLTLKVRQDHNLIIELKEKKATEINKNMVSQLKSKNILTQTDWVQYQDLFNKVYPDFLPSLLISYPELSQAEIRCLCLEKLQLTNKEMALVLGVSANTVRVTKHRIRKKLSIESHEDMESVIQDLESE